MKVLIVSDTHRHNDNLMKVLELEKPIDTLIHLGDIEGSEALIRSSAGCQCYMVAGNNDYFSSLNKDIKTRIGKYWVLMTHGHNYYVSLGYERLALEAISQGVNIAMFGHTHRPVVETMNGVIMVNPGSLSYPRQANGKPSYIVMDVDKKGEVNFEIKYL